MALEGSPTRSGAAPRYVYTATVPDALFSCATSSLSSVPRPAQPVFPTITDTRTGRHVARGVRTLKRSISSLGMLTRDKPKRQRTSQEAVEALLALEVDNNAAEDSPAAAATVVLGSSTQRAERTMLGSE